MKLRRLLTYRLDGSGTVFGDCIKKETEGGGRQGVGEGEMEGEGEREGEVERKGEGGKEGK